jgi:hypothetical protein
VFAKALRPAFIDEIVGRRHMGAIAAPEWITLYQFHTQLFVAATSVGDGRVMVAGSEAVLSVIDQRRESLFIEITVRWLRGDRERIVVVSDKPSAPENLMRTLQKLEYDATFLSRPGQVLTSTDLENVGALIVDNSTVPFTKEEIDAVRTFLAGGGGMLAVGTGLEWQGNLDDYPMNQLLAKSGAKWTGEAIHVEVKSTTTVSRPRIQILKDSDILTEKNKIEKAAVRCQARHESVNDSLRLKFKVKPNGRVSDARVNPEGLPVGECVLDKLAAQRFPESLQGGSFTWTVSLQ